MNRYNVRKIKKGDRENETCRSLKSLDLCTESSSHSTALLAHICI